jgi:Fe-S-cluster containining protein
MPKHVAPKSTEDRRERVARIQASPALLRALMDLYARVDARIAEADVACRGDGACCHFARAGHRLFVSPVELAMLTLDEPRAPELLGELRCPYQVEEKCTARLRRPLGCRTYFCQADDDWSAGVYEEFHGEITRLHDTHDAPYEYMELSAAVAEVFPPERSRRPNGPEGEKPGVFCVDSGGGAF